MKHRKLLWLAAAAGVWLLLLVILLLSERGAQGSGIRTFGDALWYSLVTLTTVGYGDLFPVTAAGRAVGFLFLCGSVGILAAVVSAALTLFRSTVLPSVRLRGLKRRKVYLFSEMNSASAVLAEALLADDPSARAAVPGAPDAEPQGRGRVLRLPGTLTQTAEALRERGCLHGVFLMAASEERNLADATLLADAPCPVLCMAPETDLLPRVRFFDPAAGCARQFWQEHPVRPEEGTVLLVGDGALARAMLDQAVLTNCRVPFAASEYHLFGRWDGYRRTHFMLDRTLFRAEEGDRFRFHDGPWEADPDLLARADRVVFCMDEPSANTAAVCRLLRCFPVTGRVFACGETLPAPVVSFGDPKRLFTPEWVLRAGQDRAAQALHRLYGRETGNESPWEEQDAFVRASNRAAADHLRTKLAILLPERDGPEMTPEAVREALRRFAAAPRAERERFRQCEHERWMRFHLWMNWQYGEVRDPRRRTHPSLVEYGALSAAEQAKDDYAWETLRVFGEEGGGE